MTGRDSTAVNGKILEMLPCSLDDILAQFPSVDRRGVWGQIKVMRRWGYVITQQGPQGKTHIYPGPKAKGVRA